MATDWRYEVLFDGGVEGHHAGAYSGDADIVHGFPGSTGSQSLFSSTHVYAGDMACRMRHAYVPNPAMPWHFYNNSTDDWGECMGTVGLGSNVGLEPGPQWLTEGDEFWYGAYFYFAAPWTWSAAYWGDPPYLPDPPYEVRGGHTKIMRVRSRFLIGSAWTGSAGILSLIARTTEDGTGNSAGLIQLSCEPAGWTLDTQAHFDVGIWQWIEYNVKLGTAGNGHFRAWKDGALIGEDTTQATWRCDIPVYAVDGLIMSQWNGTCPDVPRGSGDLNSYQDSYHDHVIFTNVMPATLDNDGNPMIGPIGWGYGPGQRFTWDASAQAQAVTKGFNEQGRRIRPANGTTYTEGGGR